MRAEADSRFGRVLHPESFADLITFAAGDASKPYDVWMWRGQSDCEWLLHSGIYRKLALKESPVTERSVRFSENWLLEKATHRGYRFFEGRQLADFELLARLQHHGAATRLIDTTRNVLVALFFACRAHHDRDGMLFGIHANHLGGGEGKLLSGSYDALTKSIEDLKHPQTWEPPNISSRVSAQHSQFVYSSVAQSGSHGSVVIEEKEKHRYLLAIQIPASLKVDFIVTLRKCFDITELTMFPDLDGFARRNGPDLTSFSDERW